MKALLELADLWRKEANVLAGYGAIEAAAAAQRHAEELVEALDAAENELLTQAEAAEFSGYSSRRLRELEAEGKLENHGRKGAPQYRRRDLPRKAQRGSDGFDVQDHVRDILGAAPQ